ncbi:hypothetical protein [Steroidobacter sp.]|uniref:hypothetical protein n=1 Tax=Steroidobacter sp. TaxID=1978227 RepID=UPI001A47C775|nr:hypothetical protein [Steroidobacter sp.]MBL8269953.1 hypothetical protein [Steroidobacter sp.]
MLIMIRTDRSTSSSHEEHMKARIKLACLAAALVAVVPAWSSTAYQGQLQDMHFMSSGIVLISTTGSRTTAPSCSTVAGRFAFDSTTAGGRTMLAGLIAAEAADRSVVIVGNGTCSAYADSETISYFYVVG